MENVDIKARYEEILGQIDADIAEAQKYSNDLKAKYGTLEAISDIITVQSMVLKIQDYVSQKRMTRTEIERQYLELK